MNLRLNNNCWYQSLSVSFPGKFFLIFNKLFVAFSKSCQYSSNAIFVFLVHYILKLSQNDIKLSFQKSVLTAKRAKSLNLTSVSMSGTNDLWGRAFCSFLWYFWFFSMQNPNTRQTQAATILCSMWVPDSLITARQSEWSIWSTIRMVHYSLWSSKRSCDARVIGTDSCDCSIWSVCSSAWAAWSILLNKRSQRRPT